MRVPVSIRTRYFMANKKALVDSGATDNFIHPTFAKRLGLTMTPLETPKRIYNIDNTSNKSGSITHSLELKVTTKGIEKVMRFLVTDIGNEDILLGYPWLATFEPKFGWKDAIIETQALPIIITSTVPVDSRSVIAGLQTEEEKREIIQELEETTTIRGIATELAIQAGEGKKKVEIPAVYDRFKRLFSEEASQQFPPKRPWDHAIELKSDAPDAIPCKVYPMTPVEDKALEEFIREQYEKGYIRPSKSPYASPFFFIKKRDGKLRPVQDYRCLNSYTIKNQYPLPLIADLTNSFAGAHIFTKLDIRWGYNNVRIKEGDEWKAAFKTKYGLWEPTVMFFGLCNSPSTFQAMMDWIFRPIIDKWEPMGTKVGKYMDDIAVATCTNEANHIQCVTEILELAMRYDLFFKPEKCIFHAPRMDYLGIIIEKGMTRMDPVKVEGIRNWPRPTKVKDIRSFLGFCNFYRPFIRGFTHIARPHNELTKKDIEWNWTTRQEEAFKALKERVSSEPVLAHPELDKQFEVEVDASGFALGAVLLQKKSDGKKHPIAYYSSTLNAAERNYDIYELEYLAIHRAMMHWRHFLAGSPHKIIIHSDHQNLTYWKDPQKLSRRIARERLDLMEFDFEIRHIPGKANSRADALSRRPDYDTGLHDNENVIVLPESVFVWAVTVATPEEGQDEEILKPWIDPHKLKRVNGVWYKEGKRVVTNTVEGKRSIVKSRHDPPVYGHPGISKTTQLVERDYWWPRMKLDIADYVKGCAECQRHKVNNRPTRAPLNPIYPKAEAMPFETVAIDFITKLPVSQGYNSILTVTDHDCTKAAIFIPCNEEINAEQTAALYLRQVVTNFGLPNKIISNRDPRFVSKFTRELCRLMGIEQNISTAYHPRTDGQSERTNQWVETFLRFVTNYKQDDWARWLPMAQFAHNNWPSDTTRKSPFFLLMGYNPRADWKSATSPIPQVTLRVDQFKEARAQAQNLMIKAQKSWIRHKDTPKYKEGDLVWLEGKNLRTAQPTPKLGAQRHGPFKVVQVMSPINYRLELPTQWSIHPVFHIDLLTPYRETITHGANYLRPPPNLVDNAEEYEVEKILDSWLFGRRRRLQYLVKWKGYPDSDNMWVDKDDVFADDKVRAFKDSNPEARMHLRATRSTTMPHFPLAPSRSSSTSYYAPRILSMSSDERSDLPNAHDGESSPRASPRPESPGDVDIADAIRLLRISTPPINSIEFAETASILAHLRPLTPFARDEDRHRVEARATTSRLVADGRTQPRPAHRRDDSSHPDYEPDTRHCNQCDGPMEYCHGHDSPDPVPVPAPVTPIFVRHPSGTHTEMAQVRLAHADVAALAAQIARLVNEDHEDTIEVPAPPFILANERSPQGMGVRRGRRGGQARGIARPESVRPPSPPAYMRAAAARAAVPVEPPEGFVHNIGEDFIPFTITNEHGVPTPARYIQVHMTADPYVIGHLTLTGADYRAELHATPNNDEPVQHMSDRTLRMFDRDYPAADVVNTSVSRIGDRTLEAEIMRHQSMMARLDVNQQKQKTLKLEQERLELTLGMCRQRLQDARACNRVLDDMVADQHIRHEARRGRGRGRPA